jgi:hypothetical protein
MFDQNKDEAPAEKPVSVEDLVGEGKKYSSVEELAKAYYNADSHIQKIENENKELRVKAEAKIQAEELLKGLSQQEPVQPEQTPSDNHSHEGTGEDVQAMVERMLNERESSAKAATNTRLVEEALSAAFGSKAREVFETKAKELNTDLRALSAQSPQLVLQAFGVSGKAPSSSAPLPTSNMSAHSGTAPAIDGKSKLKELYNTGKLSRQEYFKTLHEKVSSDPNFLKR